MNTIKITDTAGGFNDGNYVLGPTTQITVGGDFYVPGRSGRALFRRPKTKRHARRNGLTATERRRRRKAAHWAALRDWATRRERNRLVGSPSATMWF